jgi:hypothetical protein
VKTLGLSSLTTVFRATAAIDEALLHKDAAPIYFEHNWGQTQPEDVREMDYKVHSPVWALGFQKLAQ